MRTLCPLQSLLGRFRVRLPSSRQAARGCRDRGCRARSEPCHLGGSGHGGGLNAFLFWATCVSETHGGSRSQAAAGGGTAEPAGGRGHSLPGPARLSGALAALHSRRAARAAVRARAGNGRHGGLFLQEFPLNWWFVSCPQFRTTVSLTPKVTAAVTASPQGHVRPGLSTRSR